MNTKDDSARSVRRWNVEHTTPEGTRADMNFATREEAEDYAQSCYEYGHTNIIVCSWPPMSRVEV